MIEKSDISKEMEQEIIREWYQEYRSMDDLIATLDRMRWEIENLSHLVEQKMADIDRLFNPYTEY